MPDHSIRPAFMPAGGAATQRPVPSSSSLAAESPAPSIQGSLAGKRRVRRADGTHRVRRSRRQDSSFTEASNATGPRVDRSRCRFTRAADLWTLQGDCALAASIELPRGVSLNGNGKTISLIGDAEQFESVAVQVSGASVRDLTIDGQDLASHCPSYFAALVVSGPGSIANIAISNVRFDEQCAAAVGVEVSVFEGAAIDLENITVANIDGVGILLTGDGRVTVAGSMVRNAATGIQVMNTIEASISDAATEGASAGVVVSGHARARVHGATTPVAAGGLSAMDSGQATLGNLTLAGFGSASQVHLTAPSLAPGSAGRAPGPLSPAPRQTSRV